MPSLWRLRLPLPDNGCVDRRGVHRMLSRWLDVDHHAQRKPWSWTTTGAGLEIGLVDDSLVARLTRHAGRDLTQVATAPWAQLAAAHLGREWTVEFVSPVTFRRGNRLVPWPSPSAVLGSLRADWRRFAAPHVGDVIIDLSKEPVIVTSFRGASEVERVVLHERPNAAGERVPVQATVGGFLGSLTYTIDGEVDAGAVGSLMALAPFSGVGAHTTRGFGGTRVPAGRGS
ncbi:CRISPR system precrRNA processing endoribonuclease RAMP protein Cas6 [Actinokineospora sp.]|uniref:CRISPR system precrRNA processing endoribonuclease RAMP protein Cas6 n=1 Tax=Actinokineospora sp. TaxID=1872133 RepID=UPI004037DA09